MLFMDKIIWNNYYCAQSSLEVNTSVSCYIGNDSSLYTLTYRQMLSVNFFSVILVLLNRGCQYLGDVVFYGKYTDIHKDKIVL